MNILEALLRLFRMLWLHAEYDAEFLSAFPLS